MSRKFSKFSINNLSYKTLLIVLLFLLISIVVLVKFVLPKKASAAWWNDGWNYRKAVNITNTSGSDLTDFQVSLSVGTSALIASGKMKNDCSDIRITDQNGNLLPYWIETNGLNACNQANTVIWVKNSSIPTSGTTVYLYYGNPSSTSASNGNNVFVFFDDFNSPTIDTNKWNVSGSMLSISGNRLRADRANGTGSLFSKDTFKRPFVLDYDFYPTQYPSGWEGGYHGTISFGTYNTSYQTEHAWIPHGGGGNSYCGLCDDGGCYHGAYVNPLSIGNILYKESMQIKPNQSGPQGVMTYTNRRDDSTGSQANDTVYTGATTGNDPLYIGVNDYGGNVSDDFEWDNWRVRKYASADPTASLQAEEVGGGPIAYWKFDEGVGATAYDSTSNQNNGNITGATWQTSDQCVSGKCLSFNSASNDYITSNSNLSLTGSQTYSVWVYPKSADWLMGILTTHDYTNTSNIGINISTNKFSISIGYTDGSREYGDKQSNYTIPLNTWSHVELVYNTTDNSVTFYVNGKFDTKWTLAKAIKFIPNKILVGQWSNSYYGNYKFNGYIDEPKIYPYARTAAQIKLDYNSRGSLKGNTANLGSQSTAPDLSSNLVAYYKFDEGNGSTVYNSGNGGSVFNANFGAGNSAPTWSTNGKYNKSLNFNNTYSYANFYTSVLNGSNQITASAWVKSNDTSQNQTIFSANPPFFLRISGGKFRVGIYTNSIWTFVNGSIPLINNTWYHLTLVYDGVNIKSYVNGILDTNTPQSGALASFATIYIGYPVPGGENYPFNGLIDEVKIYNTALTPDEVKMDYNHGSALNFGATNQTIGGTTTDLNYCIPGDTSYCASPVGEWNFEENTGTVAKDTSGNNNTGTLSGSPLWTIGKKNTGTGLKFDGIDDRVTLTSDIILNSNTDWTVSAWVKTTSSGTNSILSNKDGGPVDSDLRTNNSKIVYFHYNGAWISESGTSNIADGKWHFLTWANHSNQTIDLYVDGVEETFGASSTLSSSGPVNQIGRNWATSANASIDQVRVYNYARTPAQIAYDYNKGGPVGWWKLDECQGSSAHDSSGMNNTGSINIGSSGTQASLGTCTTSGTAWGNGASGHTNASINFDGTDDYVDLGFNFGTLSSYTISFWAKHNVANKMPISSKGNTNFYWYGDNSWRYVHGGVGGEFYYPKSVNIPYGTWGHFTVTYDGINIRIYRNGKLEGSRGSTGTADFSSGFLLGQWFGGASYQFDGQIDDVRLYNYALTTEQVKQLYNGGAVSFN